MDYEGHGKSMGARCYIRSFRRLVDDCYCFFMSISGEQILPFPPPFQLFVATNHTHVHTACLPSENLIAHGGICFLFDAELGEYRNKSRFLYGESMGGSVALLLHRKDPAFWDGAILVAPMCKVPSSMQIDTESFVCRAV
jgi:acylglycerol lipase